MCLKIKILKIAGELFFRFGIRSVSIDDICNELRISKKTFYTIFKQKDELVIELLSAIRERQEKENDHLLNSSDNVLDSFVANSRKFSRPSTIKRHVAFMFDLEKFYPQIFAEHKQLAKERSYHFTFKLLEKGIEQGMFRTDMHVEAMSMVMVNLFPSIFSHLSALQMTQEQKTEFLLDTFVRMVGSERGLEYFLNMKTVE